VPHVVAYWGSITLGSLSLLMPRRAQATAPHLGGVGNPPLWSPSITACRHTRQYKRINAGGLLHLKNKQVTLAAVLVSTQAPSRSTCLCLLRLACRSPTH